MEGSAVNWSRSSGAVPGKLGLRVALAIEEDLMRQGWRHERLVGSQASIQQRFGIGRWAFREAAKLLEMRGSARLKRGPGGGLHALAPDIETFARQVSSYLYFTLGGDDQLIHAALKALRAITRQDPAERSIIQFLMELLQCVLANVTAQHTVEENTRDIKAHATAASGSLNKLSYAQQLVRRIIADLVDIEDGALQSIGPEWEIAERYGYSLEVVRQASRILEGMELVEVRVGRHGGIFARRPRLVLSRAQLISYLEKSGVEQRQLIGAVASLRHKLRNEATSRQNPLLASLLNALEDAPPKPFPEISLDLIQEVADAHC
ncbi:regulatory protein GntR HTH [Novosphingobium sp. Rr 2-17]|nr:regulatory protein GntR HTH [Novosphingobium sp. Rr 2-17]